MPRPTTNTLAKGLRVAGVILLLGLFGTVAWQLARQQPAAQTAETEGAPPEATPAIVPGPAPAQPPSQGPTPVADGSRGNRQSAATLVASRLGAARLTHPTPKASELESLKKGDVITLPGTGGTTVTGEVQLTRREPNGWLRIGGVLPGRQGQFFFNLRQQELNGQVLLAEDGIAIGLEPQPDGSLDWVPRPIGEVICAPAAFPKEPNSGPALEPALAPAAADPPVPILNSRPGAVGVIYLDFDGATVTDPAWNGGNVIVAPHPLMSDAKVTTVWEGVADKFLPFRVNVTTDETLYNRAPVGRRMRCIMSSNDFDTGAGGIAYVGSWRLAGTVFTADVPCWVFGTNTSANKFLIHAIAHEIGHTLGLLHDGYEEPPVEYHPGWTANVTTNNLPPYRWQPVMGGGGTSAGSFALQWSRGDYTNSSNTEDDIAIISGTPNGIGFSADEDAAGVPDTGGDGTLDVHTVLQSSTDIDAWVFSTRGGNVRVRTGPDGAFGSADVQVEIRDTVSGTVVAQNDTLDTMSLDFSLTLPRGRYRLSVRPAANGAGLTSGYPVYGSIGGVYVLATYPAALPAASVTLVGLNPHPSGYLPQGATNAVLGGFSVTPSALFNLSAVTVTGTGTATSADLTNIRLVHDQDRNGAVNGTEAPMSGPIAYSSSMAFTGLDETFEGTRSYLVTANIQPAATTGRTVAIGVANGALTTTALSQIGSAAGQTRTLGTPAAPSIQTHPTATQTIAINTTVSLSVAATGFPVPTYQWYAGETGNTSSPVAGATSATFVTPALTVDTRYWVRVSNAEGSADSSSALIRVVNADLASLTTNAGPLQPLFSSGQTSYSITVAGNIDSITLTPTVAHSGSTLTVNYVTSTSGTASAPISLPVGTRFIPIIVTSQLSLVTKTYMIEVTRLDTSADLGSLALTNGTISPTFTSLATSYLATVPFSASTTRVIAAPVGLGATLSVNGTTVLPNVATPALPLQVGQNSISIRVSSQDGASAKTYGLQVTRLRDSSLASIALSQGNLQPQFSPATLSYQVAVPFETSQLTVTPTPSDPQATVQVAGGPAVNPLPLVTGANVIPIQVTAADGSTTTYNLSVTRRGNPALANLTLSSGQLQPGFDPAQTSYEATVPFSVANLRITPTTAVPGAQVRVNGAPVVSGQPSALFPLSTGTNSFSIACTSTDGLATRNYSLRVVRTSPEIELRSGPTPLGPSTSITMGLILPGSSVTRDITVHNLGSEALTGLSASVIGAPGTPFQASLPVATLAPGEEATLTLTFAPTTLGQSSCQISVASSDPDENPVQFQLTGAGDNRGAKALAIPEWPAVESPPVPSAWSDEFTGSYEGLLRQQGPPNSLLGFMSTVVSPAAVAGAGGVVSVSAQIDGHVFVFRGALRHSNGRLETSVPHPNGGSVALGLQLMRQSAPATGILVRGTLILSNPATGRRVVAEGDLVKAGYHATVQPVPDPLPGRYTLLLPSPAGSGEDEPGGDGWATLNLTRGGALTVNGFLGDGTRFTESGLLSSQNFVVLYANLYRSVPERGRIGGRLFFRTEDGISDCDGLVRWVKLPDPSERNYPAGFNLQLTAVGSAYRAPAPGERILAELTDDFPNAELSLIGPSLPPATAQDIAGLRNRVLAWTPTHRLIHYGPERLSGTVNPATGQLTGSYADPITNANFPFSGVVLQNQGRAGGHFINPVAAQTGALRILPGTNYVYPGSEDPGPLRLASPPGSPVSAPSLNRVSWTTEAASAGGFSGLLIEGGQPAGFLENVIVTAAGGVSGTLSLDGVASAFRASFEADGSTIVAIPRAAETLTLRLYLNAFASSPGAFALSGSLNSEAGRTIEIDARNRPIYTSTSPAPQAGTYTMVLRASPPVVGVSRPGGDGYATLSVSALGVCSALATLADGTKVTLTSRVGPTLDTPDGPAAHWAFYRTIAVGAARTQIAGNLHFRHVTNVSHLDGDCRWSKQIVPRAPAPPVPQFDLTLPVIGSRYTAPAPGFAAWPSLPPAPYNIWVRLHGTGLSGASSTDITTFSRAATWTPRNQLIYYGPEGLLLSVQPATGAITGSLNIPSQGLRASFGGVLLQEQELATGSYQSAGQSGLLSITVRP